MTRCSVSGFTAACPVLCSGNGQYSKGTCQCYSGWKGAECDVPMNQCIDPSCGGHGSCIDGTCVCSAGYKGEHCEEGERRRAGQGEAGQREAEADGGGGRREAFAGLGLCSRARAPSPWLSEGSFNVPHGELETPWLRWASQVVENRRRVEWFWKECVIFLYIN